MCVRDQWAVALRGEIELVSEGRWQWPWQCVENLWEVVVVVVASVCLLGLSFLAGIHSGYIRDISSSSDGCV